MNVLAGAYLWIVAAHVIFVIFWMAGLFMLPRYLVYHQEALVAGRDDDAARWVEREGKLRSIILTPAMILVWLLGLTLATVGQHWAEGWLHAKLAFVLLLSGYHGWAVGYAKRLARGEMRLDGRRLRLINEVPALAGAVIVVLAFVKPF
ncbi:CopD family protein [Sphingomonas sp. RIT328]|uniref:CopD family protein n=1 Tax=Sphingomonas sp. RIT328 TaxID=1470591 RepID=UPI00045313B8|nr:CopD family protein [Sphingomonas sp. RIT328]EZP49200.1 putative family protein [Sphingomonas sp. RIT328]